ncbi:MAG: hypothetical protein WBG86_02530 [Polyangiales bacterium]
MSTETGAVTTRSLLSPDWMLAGFEPSGNTFQFVQVDRRTYQKSSFLDHRIQPIPTRVVSVTASQVDEMLDAAEPNPAGCIFHTAFCASTLLAFCFDHPSCTLVLREPLVLAHLASRLRGLSGVQDSEFELLAKRVFAVLDRSYRGEQVVVKPSNFANALIPSWMNNSSNATQRKAV